MNRFDQIHAIAGNKAVLILSVIAKIELQWFIGKIYKADILLFDSSSLYWQGVR